MVLGPERLDLQPLDQAHRRRSRLLKLREHPRALTLDEDGLKPVPALLLLVDAGAHVLGLEPAPIVRHPHERDLVLLREDPEPDVGHVRRREAGRREPRHRVGVEAEHPGAYDVGLMVFAHRLEAVVDLPVAVVGAAVLAQLNTVKAHDGLAPVPLDRLDHRVGVVLGVDQIVVTGEVVTLDLAGPPEFARVAVVAVILRASDGCAAHMEAPELRGHVVVAVEVDAHLVDLWSERLHRLQHRFPPARDAREAGDPRLPRLDHDRGRRVRLSLRRRHRVHLRARVDPRRKGVGGAVEPELRIDSHARQVAPDTGPKLLATAPPLLTWVGDLPPPGVTQGPAREVQPAFDPAHLLDVTGWLRLDAGPARGATVAEEAQGALATVLDLVPVRDQALEHAGLEPVIVGQHHEVVGRLAADGAEDERVPLPPQAPAVVAAGAHVLHTRGLGDLPVLATVAARRVVVEDHDIGPGRKLAAHVLEHELEQLGAVVGEHGHDEAAEGGGGVSH